MESIQFISGTARGSGGKGSPRRGAGGEPPPYQPPCGRPRFSV